MNIKLGRRGSVGQLFVFIMLVLAFGAFTIQYIVFDQILNVNMKDLSTSTHENTTIHDDLYDNRLAGWQFIPFAFLFAAVIMVAYNAHNF